MIRKSDRILLLGMGVFIIVALVYATEDEAASEDAQVPVRATIAPTPSDIQLQARATYEAKLDATVTAATLKVTPTPNRTVIAQPVSTAAAPTKIAQGDPAYRHKLALNAGFTGEALIKLAALMSEPQLFSDAWHEEVELQVFVIQTHYMEAKLYDPPPRFTEVHLAYLSAIELYDAGMEDLLRGIENVDVAMLERAAEKMGRGQRRMDEVAQMIEALSY